jgi:hypothetical protein
MDRRSRRPLDNELENLERELAALTLRVAAIRNQRNQSNPIGRVASIGDRVRFRIAGQGNAEGVVIGITAHRLHIRQDRSGHVFLRAPHNVTIL